MAARPEDPLEEVLTLADLYWTELAQNRDLARPVLTFQDLVEARQAGQIGCLLTVEEGGVCRGSLPLLRTLYRLGVRILTLTWNYPNQLGTPNGQAGGLTETGFAFLAEMEALGMLPDVLPPLRRGASGTCAGPPGGPSWPATPTPGPCGPHRRNLTDEMLRALGDRGCLVGTNFYAGFLGPGATSQPADLLRHLRHMIHVAGLETVALGSDFDGIDTPLAWGDAGGMDQVVQALDQGGFSPREIDAICWENAWKFFQRTL